MRNHNPIRDYDETTSNSHALANDYVEHDAVAIAERHIDLHDDEPALLTRSELRMAFFAQMLDH